jgi:flagellar hook-associated protein 2
VNNFVNAYNALVDQISRLRSYDQATRTAGPMLGDSLLSSIESQLRRTISEPVAGADEAYATLASVGITTQANGKLAVDAAKLDAALSADFEAAAVLFGSEDGVAAKLFAQMEERLATDGALDTRSKNLVQQQKALQNRKDQIDARMEALYASYVQQFTRLDTLLSQLQVTSSYLTQQIESLGNLNKAASR